MNDSTVNTLTVGGIRGMQEMGERATGDPVAVGQVTQQARLMEAILHDIAEITDGLTKRLSLVLHSEAPSDKAEGKHKQEAVALAAHLQDLCGFAMIQRDRLQSLLHRIDL